MDKDFSLLKGLLRGLETAPPPGDFTQGVMERVLRPDKAPAAGGQAWFFMMLGFFFLVLFLMLWMGVQQMADSGVFVGFLIRARNGALAMSALMAASGLCLEYGGAWGQKAARAGAAALGIASASYLVHVLLVIPQTGFVLALSGYLICALGMAILLLKELKGHGKNA